MEPNTFGLQICYTRYGQDFWDYLQSYPQRKQIGALQEEWTVSLARQQLFLSAASHGLGACWVWLVLRSLPGWPHDWRRSPHRNTRQ